MPLSPTRHRRILRAAALRRTRPAPPLHLVWSWLLPRTLVALFSAALAPSAPPAPLQASAPQVSSAPEPLVVLVGRSGITLGDDPTPVVVLPSREEVAEHGAPLSAKRGGQNDLFLVPLADAVERLRERERAGGRAPPGEAIVVADARTPYRLILEVLYTLGRAEMGKYHLMVARPKAR